MDLTNASPIPVVSGTIDQNFFIEPIGGPKNPVSYLDRFPDELYDKSLDSHFVKLMYALLGPAGVGWLHYNYLQARLAFEDYGIQFEDLDAFYGNPLEFGRIFEETYTQDPSGLLTQDQWAQIKAQDAQFRNRALDFIHGVRAGGTPFGLQLAARSGLGHEVELVENYRALYDANSDNRLGIPYYGKTYSTEEIVIIARAEAPRSSQQTITVTGVPSGGYFQLAWNGLVTGPIAWNAIASLSNPAIVNGIYQDVQSALQAIPTIGPGNVNVTGGPGPANPWVVTFTNDLATQSVSTLSTTLNGVSLNSLTGNATTITVEENVAATNPADEKGTFAPHDRFHMVNATNRIKPVASFLTFNDGTGTRNLPQWRSVLASSTFSEVVRFVTGQQGVNWPLDSVHWIETRVEHQAPRISSDDVYHYFNAHNVTNVSAYIDVALTDPGYTNGATGAYVSVHTGLFDPWQQQAIPYLSTFTDPAQSFPASNAIVPSTDDLSVRTALTLANGTTVQLVEGMYPTDYLNLPGVPDIPPTGRFWASLERISGIEYLEVDLGSTQAINFLSFDTTKKPISISITYDALDETPARSFIPVTPTPGIAWPDTLVYLPEDASPWQNVQFSFGNLRGGLIYTRYVRIGFRRNAVRDTSFGTAPWSIEVRNLRVGRNVSNV